MQASDLTQPRNLMLAALAGGALLGTALGAASKPVMNQAPEPAWRALFERSFDSAGTQAYPEAAAPQDLAPYGGPVDGYAPLYAWDGSEQLGEADARTAAYGPIVPLWTEPPFEAERPQSRVEPPHYRDLAGEAAVRLGRTDAENGVTVRYGLAEAPPQPAAQPGMSVESEASAPATEQPDASVEPAVAGATVVL